MSGLGDESTIARMGELLNLLKANPELMKTAQKMVVKSEEEKRKTVRTSAKNYRYVMLHTKCEHCGFLSHRMVRLTKVESISYRGKDNENHIVRFSDCKELLNVNSFTQTCNNCAEFINKMDVEELKIRYWNAINRTPFDMKHPPEHPKKLADVIDIEDSIIQEGETPEHEAEMETEMEYIPTEEEQEEMNYAS